MDAMIPKPMIESWDKHQKKFKWAIYLVSGFLGLLLFAHYLSDITNFVDGLVNLTQQLLVLAVSIAALFLFLYGAKKLSKGVIIFLDNLELKAEMAAIRADPFGTAQNAINKSRKRLEGMAEHIKTLLGSIERLKSKIADFLLKAKQQIAKGQAADKRIQEAKAKVNSPNATEATQAKNEVKRYTNFLGSAARMRKAYEDSAERLKPNLTRAETLYAFLIEFQEYSRTQIDDAQALLELRKEEYDINKDSQEAVQAAVSALDGAQKRQFDMAMMEIHTQIYNMVGEIEYVSQMMSPILDQKRFDNEVELQQALDSFQKYITEDTAVSSEVKQQLLISAGTSVPVDEFMTTASQGEPVPVRRTAGSKYDVR
jgi:hypothetical protein